MPPRKRRGVDDEVSKKRESQRERKGSIASQRKLNPDQKKSFKNSTAAPGHNNGHRGLPLPRRQAPGHLRVPGRPSGRERTTASGSAGGEEEDEQRAPAAAASRSGSSSSSSSRSADLPPPLLLTLNYSPPRPCSLSSGRGEETGWRRGHCKMKREEKRNEIFRKKENHSFLRRARPPTFFRCLSTAQGCAPRGSRPSFALPGDPPE